MSVYTKLQAARVALQSSKMKKSGNNKFAGYSYFELGDFLPTVNSLFAASGLCSIVSFSSELASLRIVDTDDGSEVVFTSPMAEANLKGCHPIQNLGAVETYQRRYLYVTALEIVEHDALDAAEPVNKETKPESAKSVSKDAWDRLNPDEQRFLDSIAIEAISLIDAGEVGKAMHFLEGKRLDTEEKVAINSRFNSKQRAAMKQYKQDELSAQA